MENNKGEKVITSADIMLSLCDSVTSVLTTATGNQVRYTPMVQRISKTTLRPDIGTFVLFSGSFSGMVVINFPKESALELYSDYMTNMGLSPSDFNATFISDEVQNSLGELMNQMIGNFTGKVSAELHGNITQSQPKMLALPHELQINMNMTLDNPVVRRITFFTQGSNVFYLELAMDDTDFTVVREFQEHSQLSPDDILDLVNGEL